MVRNPRQNLQQSKNQPPPSDSGPYKTLTPPPPPPGGDDSWELQYCKWWGWNWVKRDHMDVNKFGPQGQQPFEPNMNQYTCDYYEQMMRSGVPPPLNQYQSPGNRKVDKAAIKELCNCIFTPNRPRPSGLHKLYSTPSNSVINQEEFCYANPASDMDQIPCLDACRNREFAPGSAKTRSTWRNPEQEKSSSLKKKPDKSKPQTPPKRQTFDRYYECPMEGCCCGKIPSSSSSDMSDKKYPCNPKKCNCMQKTKRKSKQKLTESTQTKGSFIRIICCPHCRCGETETKKDPENEKEKPETQKGKKRCKCCKCKKKEKPKPVELSDEDCDCLPEETDDKSKKDESQTNKKKSSSAVDVNYMFKARSKSSKSAESIPSKDSQKQRKKSKSLQVALIPSFYPQYQIVSQEQRNIIFTQSKDVQTDIHNSPQIITKPDTIYPIHLNEISIQKSSVDIQTNTFNDNSNPIKGKAGSSPRLSLSELNQLRGDTTGTGGISIINSCIGDTQNFLTNHPFTKEKNVQIPSCQQGIQCSPSPNKDKEINTDDSSHGIYLPRVQKKDEQTMCNFLFEEDIFRPTPNMDKRVNSSILKNELIDNKNISNYHFTPQLKKSVYFQDTQCDVCKCASSCKSCSTENQCRCLCLCCHNCNHHPSSYSFNNKRGSISHLGDYKCPACLKQRYIERINGFNYTSTLENTNFNKYPWSNMFISPLSGKAYDFSTQTPYIPDDFKPSQLPHPMEIDDSVKYLETLQQQAKKKLNSDFLLDVVCDAILFRNNIRMCETETETSPSRYPISENSYNQEDNTLPFEKHFMDKVEHLVKNIINKNKCDNNASDSDVMFNINISKDKQKPTKRRGSPSIQTNPSKKMKQVDFSSPSNESLVSEVHNFNNLFRKMDEITKKSKVNVAKIQGVIKSLPSPSSVNEKHKKENNQDVNEKLYEIIVNTVADEKIIQNISDTITKNLEKECITLKKNLNTISEANRSADELSETWSTVSSKSQPTTSKKHFNKPRYRHSRYFDLDEEVETRKFDKCKCLKNKKTKSKIPIRNQTRKY